MTVLHPIVAVAMLLALILIFCLARKHVIVPLLLGLFLIPKGQQIVAAGVHFNVYRIIILAGLTRCFISKRTLVGGFNFMDRVCTALFLWNFVTNSLLYMQGQAVVKSAGDLLDMLGGYFVLRFLIRDRDDIIRTIKTLAVIAIISAVCMLNEQRTGVNVFGMLGGEPVTGSRDGKIRSQAAFEVFLTAGTYGATLLPLLIWLWSQARCKAISVVGIVSALIMSFTCYASTTLVGAGAGIVALFCWPIRERMRVVRWGIVVVLIGLHLVMHGPVWSLLEHIDLTGSSSSYHRYMLIDNGIRHFSDWWLIGTKDNGSWGWEMWDTSDQYVAYAFSSGLLGLVLFISIISLGFSRLAKARRLLRGKRREEWFLWCLGAALFSHVVGFFGLNYMDQMQYAWFALLAIISVSVFEAKQPILPARRQPEARTFEFSSAHNMQEVQG